jgi:hypothetical protein
MRASIYQTVIRHIIGSLISSDLSIRDLEEVASLLASNDRLWREASNRLRAAIDARGYSEPSKTTSSSSYPLPGADDKNLVSAEIFAVFSRRRKSKRDVARLLSSIAPQMRTSVPVTAPLTYIVDRFLEVASPKQIEELILRLGISRQGDPFLRGIVGKR